MTTAAPTATDPSEVLIPAKAPRKGGKKGKAPKPAAPVSSGNGASPIPAPQAGSPPAAAPAGPVITPASAHSGVPITPAPIAAEPPPPAPVAAPPPPKPRPPAPPTPPGATPSLAEPLSRALCPLLGQINPEGDPIFPAPECAAFVEEATRGMQTVLEALLRARRGNPDEVLAFSGHKLEVLAREHLPKNLQLPAKAAALAFLRGLFVLLPMVG